MIQRAARTSEELDVSEVARSKLALFGDDAHTVLLTRAENFRRHGQVRNAAFWRAVAETVAALSAPDPGG